MGYKLQNGCDSHGVYIGVVVWPGKNLVHSHGADLQMMMSVKLPLVLHTYLHMDKKQVGIVSVRTVMLVNTLWRTI